MNANLMEILCAQAAQRGNQPALIEGRGARRRVLSFADLDRETARMASALCRAGLVPGDTVLLLHPVSIDLFVALLAVFRAGLVAVLLDPSAGRAHLRHCADLVPLRGLVGSLRARLLTRFLPALREIPLRVDIRARADPADRGTEPRVADDPALITFTSGSTGLPKAVARSHGFLVSQHRALAASIALEAGEIDLVTLPVFLLANLASGLTSVLPAVDLRAPGAIDAAVLVGQIEREGVARMAASPALFERLIEHGERTGATMRGLRKLFTGGAPVFPRTLESLRRVAPEATIAAVYGSTEAEPIAHLDAREIQQRDLDAMAAGAGLLAGRLEPCIDLRVIGHRDGPIAAMTGEDFATLVLSPDEAGEIVVAGDHVLQGYWQGRGDEETKFRVAGRVWHRTGDAGRLDAAGRLWLLGRASARIRRGDGTLHPFAVETAASGCSVVRRSALVEVNGRVVLAVEPSTGAEAEDLQQDLALRLAWAGLDEIRIVEKIPVDRRHNAKVDYPVLRKMMTAHGDVS
jgi:acyl-CoA synthetase (AMP-forming)/AMP-acid ligase II